MKIKTRMLLFIALPVLLATLIITGSSFIFSKRIVEDISKRELLVTAKKYGSDYRKLCFKRGRKCTDACKQHCIFQSKRYVTLQ